MEIIDCFMAWKGGSQWASTSPCHILHLLDEAQRGEFYTRDFSCVHLSICAFLGDFCVRMYICLFCCLIWSLSMVKFNHVQGDVRAKGKHLLGKLLGNTSRTAVFISNQVIITENVFPCPLRNQSPKTSGVHNELKLKPPISCSHPKGEPEVQHDTGAHFP